MLFRSEETKPETPKLMLTKPGKEITEGSVGEFDHEMLLRQYAGEQEASSLSPHLRGGQFQIVAAGNERKPVLAYASEWDSEETAARFFADYQRILQAKWKHCDPATASRTVFAGSADDGYFVTRLAGSTVTSIEGVSEWVDWQRLRAGPRQQVAVRLPFRARANRP